MRLQFRNAPLESAVDFKEIAERTERFSGADLARLASRAKKIAAERLIAANDPVIQISDEDVKEALDLTRPTVSQELLDKYPKWRAAYDGSGPSVDFDDGDD